MPPKAPPAKKKPVMAIIDGIDTIPMKKKQLETFAYSIKDKIDKEIELRDFYKLERDKIQKFWEISRSELDEARAELRNKDRLIEEEIQKDDEDLKNYKQKVKHLRNEQLKNLIGCKTDALVSLQNAMDEHIDQEKNILGDKRDLERTVREQEIANEDQIKDLKLEHSKEINKVREKFEEGAREVELKYDKKFTIFKKELETKHNIEMAKTEGRKNTDILNLTQTHEKNFNDMKVYYNDITLNNLTLISTLKDKMEILRNQNQRNTKILADATAENRNLVERMNEATAEVEKYKILLQNYEKDKKLLAHTVKKLIARKKDVDQLRWTNEALLLRFEKLQAEYDELHKRFVKAKLVVQQKTSIKNEMLKRRIQVLDDAAEYQDAVIGQLSIEEKTSPRGVNKRLEKILAEKNTTIKDLQYELARVCKLHDNLVESYEETLSHYGVPKEELGYTPMRIIPKRQEGPDRKVAKLVTKN